jgi:hypothetical protein
MTSTARPRRRRQHATAARQALRLCEADLTRLTWDTPSPPIGAGRIQGQVRISPITARAALRAVGVPPLVAAALRRLRLIPEQEAER